MKTMFNLTMALVLAAIAGCGSSPKSMSVSDKDRLHAQVQSTRAEFVRADPGMEKFFRDSYAYAIFPDVASGAVVVGGSHGNGEVYRGGILAGYADVSKASVGAQVGGQSYAQVVFFEDGGAYAKFTGGTMELDAKASAVAASTGASTSASYRQGVLVFTRSQSGLMVQAAVGGQKFRFIASGD